MTAADVRFPRVVVLLCDSVGVGDAPDADRFCDAGANTLGHVIAAARPQLPHLAALGLGRLPGIDLGVDAAVHGAFGRLTERGPGKDTMLGHWELMGVVAPDPLPLFPGGFPDEVLADLRRLSGRGIVGNRPASGTAIIEELGPEHLVSGDLIVYTSGDSVLQIAAHDSVLPEAELHELCRAVRKTLRGGHAVGRVIARPFVGSGPGTFRRTSGRKDFPLPPPGPTALDLLSQGGVGTRAIGKVNDIFAGHGIDTWQKSNDNGEGIAATIRSLRDSDARLIFTNLVDFDTDFGHRNDPVGYAGALEELDAALPALVAALPDDGCLVLTADHGNDPTFPGTDHTRERVPLLVTGRSVGAGPIGTHDFADLGATLLENFGIQHRLDGRSFLSEIPRARNPGPVTSGSV